MTVGPIVRKRPSSLLLLDDREPRDEMSMEPAGRLVDVWVIRSGRGGGFAAWCVYAPPMANGITAPANPIPALQSL